MILGKVILRMRRRAYLGGLVSVAVAGCLGENSAPAGQNGDRESEKNAAIEVVESEIVSVKGLNSTEPAVRATVENQSSTSVSHLTLFADFLDKDGNVVETEDRSLIELEPGYKWETTIVNNFSQNEIQDYDIRMEHDQGAPTVPDGVSIRLANTKIHDERVESDVLVENHTDEEQHITAGAQLVGEDFVLGEQSFTNFQIPPEKTWKTSVAPDYEGDIEQVRPVGYGGF
jgi:hypothetical protein